MSIVNDRTDFLECCDNVNTSATPDGELASRMHVEKVAKNAWNRIIDNYLIEWGNNPESVADEGIVPPSREIISKACEVAILLRDQLAPPPLRVVPDGEGGVVFERRTDSGFQSLYVLHDNTIEFLTFDSDSKLVDRAVIG